MTDYLLGYTLQVSVLMLAALAATAALRRRSAALRHWVLAAAVACAASLPALQAVVPDWPLAVTPREAAAPGGRAPAVPSPAGPAVREMAGARAPADTGPDAPAPAWPLSLMRLVPAVWLAGAAAGLVILLTGLARLTWLARRARPLTHPAWVRAAGEVSRDLGMRRTVLLLHTDHPALLAAWGVVRPRIMLPGSAVEWPADQVDVVLRHEMAHLVRADWVAQLVAEVLRALNWFNPVAWVVTRRLRSESELACDDAVLERGVRGADYAARLVALARMLNARRRWSPSYPAPAMARPSSLERRVSAMLNPELSRVPLTAGTRAAVACLVLAVALPVAGLAVFAQAPASFTGSVLDPTSRGVPNTQIVLTNVQTQARQEVRSDAAGHFKFAGLPAGDYAMEASLPGFMTIKGTVTVPASGLTRDLKLQIGSISETINVSIGTAQGAPPAGAGQAPPAPRTLQRARPPAPCSDTAAGGNIRPPRKLRDVKPQYPEHLKAEKVTGRVVVTGFIGKDGLAHDLKVVESPHPDLGRAVVDAVSRWEFDATLLNCGPVDVKFTVTANFKL